jgi:hypothetical protein
MPKICTEASENHLSKHVHKRLSVPWKQIGDAT